MSSPLHSNTAQGLDTATSGSSKNEDIDDVTSSATSSPLHSNTAQGLDTATSGSSKKEDIDDITSVLRVHRFTAIQLKG